MERIDGDADRLVELQVELDVDRQTIRICVNTKGATADVYSPKEIECVYIRVSVNIKGVKSHVYSPKDIKWVELWFVTVPVLKEESDDTNESGWSFRQILLPVPIRIPINLFLLLHLFLVFPFCLSYWLLLFSFLLDFGWIFFGFFVLGSTIFQLISVHLMVLFILLPCGVNHRAVRVVEWNGHDLKSKHESEPATKREARG